MEVEVSSKGIINANVIDNDFDEPYTLHLDTGANGRFVGIIREHYENTLKDICASCFDKDVYKEEHTRRLIAEVEDKYDSSLEFLWNDSPTTSVLRRKDTKKWYAVLFRLSKRKLGMDSDDIADVINLRTSDNKYYPAYHMNKKNWCSIIIGEIPLKELMERVEESYILAIK